MLGVIQQAWPQQHCCCNYRGPLNLAPWLVVIPGELNPFQALLEALGVPAAFDGAQYAAVLANMAAQHPDRPLPAATLEQAISIVQVPSCVALSGGTQEGLTTLEGCGVRTPL